MCTYSSCSLTPAVLEETFDVIVARLLVLALQAAVELGRVRQPQEPPLVLVVQLLAIALAAGVAENVVPP